MKDYLKRMQERLKVVNYRLDTEFYNVDQDEWSGEFGSLFTEQHELGVSIGNMLEIIIDEEEDEVQ